MKRIAVFGGTADGRALCQYLAEQGVAVDLFVATDYGRDMVTPMNGLTVIVKRLEAGEMASRFASSGYGLVVDATHPYASVVTANVKAACQQTGLRYLRMVRGEWKGSGVQTVASIAEAAQLLQGTQGKVLLTVGSKELEAFTVVDNWQERLYARVLPSVEVITKCTGLGFSGRSLLCVQGPFSHAMNVATIRDLGVRYLVTKDSGDAGGFGEKLSAVEETGITMLLVRRPTQEEGYSPEALAALLANELDLLPPPAEQLVAIPQPRKPAVDYPRFPMFVPLDSKPVLLVGGGGIAQRRVETLLRFGAVVTVVSPQLTPALQALAHDGKIHWHQQLYAGEVAGFALVVAATDQRQVNRQVGEDATAQGIPVSVADCREASTFWFPGVAQKGNLVAGVTSSDGDHAGAKALTSRIRQLLEQKNI